MDDRISITLLRHGMTADNERSAYIGWANPSLSEKGRKDVELISDQLVGKHIEFIYSSDLNRCTETAEILFPNDSPYEMIGLREMDFGDWDRKTYEELKHIASYRNWLDNLFESGPDGGETFITFSNRIERAFKEIKQHMLANSLKEVAIVTHGGVIRSLLTMLMNSTKTFFDWKVPYGSGYQLCWNEKEFRRGTRCTSLQEVPITERQHG